jgi:putative sugar O-methyltransferase
MNTFLKKVQKNYEKSILSYDNSSKSKYWKKSIIKKRKLFNIKYLKKFRSNNLSKNIDDFYLNKKDITKYYENLKSDCGNKFINRFLFKGNVAYPKKFIKLKNKLITASDLFHIKYIFELKKKINLKKINSICEVGQGFGLLASKLLKIKNYKMILIDLPESNYLTSYYLKKLYPQKKIIMDIDIPNGILTKKIFKKGDLFVITPWIKIDDVKLDLFINSRSMMEMNYETIKSYFNLIESKTSRNGFFLCINRYYKDLVGYPIEFHRYPFNDNWKTIISKQSWMQSHTHFLLTKKVDKKKSDIKETLKYIKLIYLDVLKNDKFFLRRWLPINLYRFYKSIKYFIFN